MRRKFEINGKERSKLKEVKKIGNERIRLNKALMTMNKTRRGFEEK